jgi:hypothetical protein
LALPCALWKLQLDGYGKTFCLQATFCQKSQLKNKIKRFWWVSITKSEGNSQNHQMPIVGFQCVAINIGGYFKNYTSYLVYSQLLLNIIRTITISEKPSYWLSPLNRLQKIFKKMIYKFSCFVGRSTLRHFK